MPQRKKPRGKPASPQPPKPRNSPAGNPSKTGTRLLRGSRLDEKLFPSRRLALYLLVAITFIAFANAWPNSLTFDDKVFGASDRFASIGPADMWRFFTEDLWAASGVHSGLYRPLLLVLIAIETWVFGSWVAGHHLVNIFLHVLATVLVYGFVRHLLTAWGGQPRISDLSALLAAVIFGVHPVHAEVVNSIFNGSEALVTIGVVGGLWWFLRNRQAYPIRAWSGLSVIYLLVLLCRESGAALPGLAVAMLWLSSAEPWLRRLRQCLPVVLLVIPLGIYLGLRAHALQPKNTIGPPAVVVEQIVTPPEVVEQIVTPPAVADAPEEDQPEAAEVASVNEQPPVAEASQVADGLEKLRNAFNLAGHGVNFGPQRIYQDLSMWFEGWKLMLWPHPLQIYYDWPDTSTWLVLTTQLALLVAAIAGCFWKFPGPLAGMAFFYLAILPSSQILGSGVTFGGMADRVLYLPSVGLAIILAATLSWLLRRFGPRATVVPVTVIALVMVPLCWARNAEWINDVVLFESTYEKLQDKEIILHTLLAAYLKESRFDRAVEVCDEHMYVLRRHESLGAHCGSAYGQVGRWSDAEKAFLHATRHHGSRVFAHFNLAMMYIHLGRRNEATQQFELAMAGEKRAFMREYFTALMLMKMHPGERVKLLDARAHLERALQLQPQHALSRQELDELNARLIPPKRNANQG